MAAESLSTLTFRGKNLSESENDFGELRRADHLVHDRDALHARMAEDGYLYLPGLLNMDDALEARMEILHRLDGMGAIDKTYPLAEGVFKPGNKLGSMTDFTRNNPSLMNLLYAGRLMDFYRFFLDGPIAHFDYTWFRVKAPGISSPTQPHYDIVYMGRGTHNLYTSWTPLGDVPFEMGGLMVLENSHKNEELRQTYGRIDVDKYCANEEEARHIVETAKAENRELTNEERTKIRWNGTGSYAEDAIDARKRLGGRWLTADFKLGDILIFSVFLLHASSDNHTNRVRISSDSRYQLATEDQDERWIGDNPPAHGIRAKQGMIC
ncbi:MAG: phytanoyl-CoA dioxygenase family protein [bacterium]|nr:phytanoyl-CoA dioxygenase family protein [bacterium]